MGFLRNNLPGLLAHTPQNVRERIVLQHDGAPAHFSRQVQNWLNREFPDHWIGRGSNFGWPPRSPDFNPLDFFYWGHLKTLVYEGAPPENDAELERRIRDAAHTIPAEMVAKATNSVVNRARLCIQERGCHFEQLLR